MDEELLGAGIEVIRELCEAKNLNLPNSSYKTIATHMLKSDKLGDDSWCLRKIMSEDKKFQQRISFARKNKFYPFVNIGLGACKWIRRNYGAWTLDVMEEKLKNPFDAYTNWAIRFAAAMKVVGFRECKQSDDLYSLVVNHPSWDEMQKENKSWSEHIKKIKSKKKFQKKLDHIQNTTPCPI